MDERILIGENGNSLDIAPAYDRQKQLLLNAWLVLWTICGLGILSQFFMPSLEGMTWYLFVWTGFWIYFEYKVIYAFRWRKWGKERLRFESEALSITTEISGRGIPRNYEVDYIKKVRHSDEYAGAFVKIMSQSYWNIGNEQIAFDYKGREIRFGRDLGEADRRKVIRWLEKGVLARQSS